ncbi:hypothetical protein BDR06DRAFT_836375, partial [Suillus hirtellus]
IKGRYEEDPFFRTILDAPESYKNFQLLDGHLRLKLEDRELLCILDILVGGCKMLIDQAHSLLAHLGARKTMSYLREYVWWK